MILSPSHVMRPKPPISTLITFTGTCPQCQQTCEWTQHMGEKPQPTCRCT